MKKEYTQTYNENLRGNCHQQFIDEDTTLPHKDVDVIVAGPPCQPWSEAGKNLGDADERDGFPALIECISRLRPEIFLIENVEGLYKEKHKPYLNLIVSELKKLRYTVVHRLIDMSKYGVPQKRKRVFIIGSKAEFSWPKESDVVFSAGDALGKWSLEAPEDGEYLTPAEDKRIAGYEEKCQLRTPRDLHLDKPARTLTCKNLANSTNDMHRILLPDGRRRKLRVKEAARLQGFPDWFKFSGDDTCGFNQIGQAVPPVFAHQMAKCIASYLDINTNANIKNSPIST